MLSYQKLCVLMWLFAQIKYQIQTNGCVWSTRTNFFDGLKIHISIVNCVDIHITSPPSNTPKGNNASVSVLLISLINLIRLTDKNSRFAHSTHQCLFLESHVNLKLLMKFTWSSFAIPMLLWYYNKKSSRHHDFVRNNFIIISMQKSLYRFH